MVKEEFDKLLEARLIYYDAFGEVVGSTLS
jgi:hypothetical protein